MAIDYCRKNYERMQLAKRTKDSTSLEVRHFGTQTDEVQEVDTPTVDKNCSDDDVTVTTDQPESSPPPSIVSSSTKSEAKRRNRQKSPLRRQRLVTLYPNTRGELIKAEVLAYEAVRAATTAIQAARRQQLWSAYGVRPEIKEESRGVGVGPRIGRIRAPPLPNAKNRELTIVSSLEQTYNQTLTGANGRGTSGNNIDFRIRPGTSRNLSDFTLKVQGNMIITEMTVSNR